MQEPFAFNLYSIAKNRRKCKGGAEECRIKRASRFLWTRQENGCIMVLSHEHELKAKCEWLDKPYAKVHQLCSPSPLISEP